jgi:hypothetical protein
MLAASGTEGIAKTLVGRPRPTALHPGFPSGHTTVAAAVYVLLAYFAWTTIRSTVARYAIWLVAITTILAVAISRVVLTAHWPRDTVGGAALGLMCVAAAVWWHQNRPPVPGRAFRSTWFAFQDWIDRGKDMLPIPLCAVLFSPWARRDERRVDAHNATTEIEERPPGVPRVDGSVRLDQVVKDGQALLLHRATECTDHADRDGRAALDKGFDWKQFAVTRSGIAR